MQQAKKDFLKTLIFDQTAFEEEINKIYDETQNNATKDAYFFLISQNAHRSQEGMQEHHVEKFLKEIYKSWYEFFQKYTIATDDEKLTKLIQKDLEKFRTDPKFAPENIEKNDGYSNFFIHQFKNEFQTDYWCVVKNQGFFPFLFNSFGDGFLHIYSPINNNNRNVRLYINLKTENILPVATMVFEHCYDKNIFMHFKFAPRDIRNDTFIIYTTYEDAQEYVELLKQIKRKHPQLFEGTENKNPLLASVEGAEFIGFGEEPKYKISSFNTEREIIFKMCIEEQKATIKNILNDKNKVVQNQNGKVLSVDDFLLNFFKQRLTQQISEEIEKVSRTKIKSTLNDEQVKKYLDGQKKILTQIKTGYFQGKFEDMLSAYKSYLDTPVAIEEHFISSSNICFNVSINIPDYAGQQTENKDKYDIKIPISTHDINNKLLSLFEEENKACKQRIHEKETQNKYLQENHISATFPFLNIETEQEIAKEKKTSPAFN